MQFGSISGIDQASIDLSRVTGLQGHNIRGGTAAQDSDLILCLQDVEEQGVYIYDMGEIDDLERSNLILDKDTQMVYDSRKELDLRRLEKRTSGCINTSANNITTASDGRSTTKKKTKPWANFWKKKRENNEKFLFAAEIGDLKVVQELLDTAKM